MGKPNPAKLANFPEIGVYVLVACAQTALIDSRDYYQPVLTVFEAARACGDRRWPGHLRLDSGARAEAATAEGGAAAARGGEEEEARFSMVRGAYVAATASEGEGGAAEGELGVPLYFSTQRESVLDEISLPSDDQAKWVMAGVALLTDISG